ncbi:MAG: hybrid sensor histidine kinase/response regulator [Acidobacteria bacterium]|nr:MAG: hybrid sensor histidine kinase/response regulator [Acidobacteriota bacterium]REK07702.1 MAG: hybrid sensor histidine kinase/response regulator [Acidobacteriota bacterium]
MSGRDEEAPSFLLTDMRVLLVDDDEDDAFLIRELVEEVEGGRYEIVWKPTFDEGIEAVRSEAFDACLVDNRLGDRSGLEFLQHARVEPDPPPCILLTGAATREVDVAAMRAGAADFLDKAELTPELLDRALRYSVRDRQASKSHQALLDERAARIEAEASNHAKSQFLAKLSHELRTPLTPALAILARLEQDEELSPRHRDALAVVRRNVEQEVYLIDDLLDITRIERGSFKLAYEPVALDDLLGRVIADQRRGLDAGKRLEVALELEASDHRMSADPHRLTQVFSNLVANAFKFTPDGGRVTVSTGDADGERLSVQVRDTGRGIAADELATIFGAFEQAPNRAEAQRRDSQQPGTRGRGARGLGLGLAIAKAFVEEHDGTLAARSEGLGKGACFEVVIPRHGAGGGRSIGSDSESGAAVEATAGDRSIAVRRVLLAEDHGDSRAALSELLGILGLEVIEAGSLADARRRATESDFDLLISDLDLGDGSGHELMQEVRREHDRPGIALSGFGTEADIERSHQAGFFAHLTKPIHLEDLKKVLASLR